MTDDEKNKIERIEQAIDALSKSQNDSFIKINKELSDFKQAIIERFAKLEAKSEYTEKELMHIRDNRVHEIETDLKSMKKQVNTNSFTIGLFLLAGIGAVTFLFEHFTKTLY